MKKFPIGFWNYTSTGVLGPEAVKDWADLGMTMANSPEYYPTHHKKEDMLAILDACEEHGIKVIMSDARARWNDASVDPEGYEKRFREAYEDFGHHPAVFSFHIGDEPWSDKAFADCIAAHKIQEKVAPELVPHLNILPYWKGQEKDLLHADSFGEWAEKFIAESDLKILCYDRYTQMNPEEEGVQDYFMNLRVVADAAKKAGIIPWTTLLSVGHFRYRVPNEDDLRWQINTAAACGMKGIMWFFIYERAPYSNYRLAPIDEFWEKTETYHRLSRVNRHFLHNFGDFFLNANHTATYLIGKEYGGYEMFKRDETSDGIMDVTCEQGLPAVLGFFEKDGDRYIAVVNNSWTESGRFDIHVKKGHKIERVGWNGEFMDMKIYKHDAHYSETEEESVGGDWLAPGQLKLYRY